MDYAILHARPARCAVDCANRQSSRSYMPSKNSVFRKLKRLFSFAFEIETNQSIVLSLIAAIDTCTIPAGYGLERLDDTPASAGLCCQFKYNANGP